MAKLSLKQGTTGKLLRFYAEKADGTGPFTGLLYNTASLTAYYIREGDALSTPITLVTGGTVGTWTSGTLLPVDATNMPGVYELGLPNAALASGKSTWVMLQGATNLAPIEIEIELTATDNQDGIRAGMTALPNATAGANNGLPLGDANGAVTITSAQAAIINKINALVPVQLTVTAVTTQSPPVFTAIVPANSNYQGWEVVWNTTTNANAGTDANLISAFSIAGTVGTFTLENVTSANIAAGDTLYIVGADLPKEFFYFLTNLGPDYKPLLSSSYAFPAQALSTNDEATLTALHTMIVSNAFTAPALAYAPTGSGGGGLTTPQAASLTDIQSQVDKLQFDVSNNVKANVASYAAGEDPLALLLDGANGVETGLTMRQALRLFTAVLSGVATDVSGTYTLKRRDGTTTALTVVHDAMGNRTACTLGTL